MVYAFIMLTCLGLWMFWGNPSECEDSKTYEFSFFRYFFGAIFGTIGIALCWNPEPLSISPIAGCVMGFMILIGGYAIQNRDNDVTRSIG